MLGTEDFQETESVYPSDPTSFQRGEGGGEKEGGMFSTIDPGHTIMHSDSMAQNRTQVHPREAHLTLTGQRETQRERERERQKVYNIHAGQRCM